MNIVLNITQRTGNLPLFTVDLNVISSGIPIITSLTHVDNLAPLSQIHPCSQRNLLTRGLVQIEESQVVETGHSFSYKTGSIVVDPETHHVIQPGADNLTLSRFPVFAVGAMTRGQMIDASMAQGIARSTAAVADVLITLRTPKQQLTISLQIRSTDFSRSGNLLEPRNAIQGYLIGLSFFSLK